MRACACTNAHMRAISTHLPPSHTHLPTPLNTLRLTLHQELDVVQLDLAQLVGVPLERGLLEVALPVLGCCVVEGRGAF